jgi:EmrB/QacA subfamily drug resistance transporter
LDADIWRVAVVVILGTIMSVIDTTVVNVALRSLSHDLHSSLDEIQWVVTAYLQAMAVALPLTSWAIKRYGTRRIYLISIGLFTLGSLLCGVSRSLGELILFRVVQGLGGGMLIPIGQTILVRKAGPQRLAKAMSAVGVPVILAPILGPALGGLLLDDAGWRWIFFINLPVGICAWMAARRRLERDTPVPVGPLDVGGLALIACGLMAVTYGLAQVGVVDTVSSIRVLGPVATGLFLVALFVRRSLRIPSPLLDVRLYANTAFRAAAVTTFCLGAVIFGGMILLPLYYQTARGVSALSTGLLLAPQGLGAALGMYASGRSTDRAGSGITALTGVLIIIVATVPFVGLGPHTSALSISLALGVRGLGIGLAAMPAMTAAFRALEPRQVGDASPQLTVLQRVGGSLGTALFTVVLQQHLSHAGASADLRARAFGSTFMWVISLSALAIVPTVFLCIIERKSRYEQTPVTVETIGEIA